MIITEGSIVYNDKEKELIVERFIGSGSFGDVYYVTDTDKNTAYALKTIRNPFDSTLYKAFINEGKLATEIDHKNVIKYHFFHDGTIYDSLPPYILMEYAEGGTLYDMLYKNIENSRFFENNELKSLFTDLINGMEAINSKLVHRDIKPDNILIDNGVLKITDFGLSKVVAEGTRTSTFKGFGCIQYLAPEGWNFSKNTIQMDIYSMGIVFYEMACFKHPFNVDSNDIRDWEQAHLYQAAEPISRINSEISPIIDQMISHMIAKKQSERFKDWQSIREFLQRDNLPETKNSSIIDEALTIRLERIKKNEEKRLEEERKQKEIDDYINVIKYQFTETVINPLLEFSEEFNKKAGNNLFTTRITNDGFRLTFGVSGSADVVISLVPILERDFYRKRQVNDHGRRVTVTELEIPKYQNRKLMAWGFVRGSDGRGFNLLLVENKDEEYGSWYTLTNYNHITVRSQRLPEPFPFELNELEKEIRLIRAVHIYRTEDRVLNIDIIKKFIAEYV